MGVGPQRSLGRGFTLECWVKPTSLYEEGFGPQRKRGEASSGFAREGKKSSGGGFSILSPPK